MSIKNRETDFGYNSNSCLCIDISTSGEVNVVERYLHCTIGFGHFSQKCLHSKFLKLPRSRCSKCAFLEEEYLVLTDEASSPGTWQACDFVPTIHFVVEAFQCHLLLLFSFLPVPANWRKKPWNPIKLERVGGRSKALSMSTSVRVRLSCWTLNGLWQFKRRLHSDETQLFVTILVRDYWGKEVPTCLRKLMFFRVK